MPRIVPAGWMPRSPMKRIITHWTAGAYEASDNDQEHYHILVEGDGSLVRGEHSIPDNVNTGDGDYAAHTRGCNTGSIGVAVCCMAGAIQSPFRPGRFPMRPEQYDVLATVVADLCEAYSIPVTPKTVLGHGEVQRILGIPQSGKWDPMTLPWEPGKSPGRVGDEFRKRVQQKLAGQEQDHLRAPVTILLNGAPLTDETLMLGGSSWCPLRLLADRMGWTILAIDDDSATLRIGAGQVEVPTVIRGSRGYVKVTSLCEILGWPAPAWDPERRQVAITHP
jgi:hypothetical protein